MRKNIEDYQGCQYRIIAENRDISVGRRFKPDWGTISHNWELHPPHLTGKSATASSMVMVSDSALWCC